MPPGELQRLTWQHVIGHLLADPRFELVTSHRRSLPAVSGLEHLPEEVAAA